MADEGLDMPSKKIVLDVGRAWENLKKAILVPLCTYVALWYLFFIILYKTLTLTLYYIDMWRSNMWL